MEQNYYLGLDMGTSSLGWAVTDEKYQLLRRKGKDLWGVRLFSEAETAADRRSHRVSRRRREREKARIAYLKEVFAEEINKKDPGFFQRLEDSKYYEEDKREHQPFALFAYSGYTDKEYYKDFPTIFHLRKALLEADTDGKEYDVRLVYLAILNMFKHRGHFLNATLDEKSGGNLDEYIDKLYNDLYENFDIAIKKVDISEIKNILSSKDLSNTGRLEKLLDIFELSKSKNKRETEIFKLVCGLKGKLSKIFGEDSFSEELVNFSMSFRDANYDEEIITLEDNLSEEYFEMVMNLKQIHDWSVLENIMNGQAYISQARVLAYEKHEKDLKILKSFFKKNSMTEYNKMFRQMNDNNYSSYVGSVNYKNESIRRGSKCNSEEFFKSILKAIKEWDDCEEKIYIEDEIEKGTFLPKQITTSNGVIPNQVHKKELKKILTNAEIYLPFLSSKDESGLTVSERIVEMFSFQIPYYVGPISYSLDEKATTHRNNVWSVRKESGRVYPWNFEKKIDIKKSSENFISNLINHCTYLNGESVLPKNSLLYEKFMVLNELNNLKVNEQKISVETKQDIYNKLFKKGKKVTAKAIVKYLKENGLVDNSDEPALTGIDGDFTNRLANYKKFLEIFETDTLTYEQEQIAENIIYYSTIYGDSKKFLEERIRELYGEVLNEKQIKRILGLKFKDWGRFSRELLELVGVEISTGEQCSIISKMWNDNYNFMELMTKDKFSYAFEIEERVNKIEKTLSTIEYEDLDELYISAPVKRMVWQTILVLKELVETIGYPPERIFVEMARNDEEKNVRKESRKNKLLALYANCRKEERNWKKEIEGRDEAAYRSKKLYLYYTQKGRCMYCGKQIELKNLFDDNLYDIDHIYPRHFVKDDSIENNLVLVNKECNAAKKDTFPIESNIRNKMESIWRNLKEGGFITQEKYNRLTRRDEFTDDERANFISRQIVETRQGTKAITNLFEQTFPSTEIIYVKAGNVSDFRHKFNFVKCRNVNDFHHAQDAYLNVVVGNVYYTKFTRNPLNFIKDYKRDPEKHQYHMDHMFQYPVARNGKTAWATKGGESIKTVRSVMAKNTPLVTRMNYEKHSGQNGGITDQNIYSAKKAKANSYLPIKTTEERLKNVERYGGYGSITIKYFFLVEHMKGKKKIRTIEGYPAYLNDSIENLEEYCVKVLGYEMPEIKMAKIKIKSVFKINGFYYYLNAKSDNRIVWGNAVQLKMNQEDVEYIRKLSKANDEYISEKINSKKNIELYEKLRKKYSEGIYSKRVVVAIEAFEKGMEKFETLSIKEQIEILLEMVNYSKDSVSKINLSKLGLSANSAYCRTSKEISKLKECKLINQSVTGLYENEIDLLTV